MGKENDTYKINSWPTGPGYFSKTNVESIVREIENTPEQLQNQMNVLIRYPQETRIKK